MEVSPFDVLALLGAVAIKDDFGRLVWMTAVQAAKVMEEGEGPKVKVEIVPGVGAVVKFGR